MIIMRQKINENFKNTFSLPLQSGQRQSLVGSIFLKITLTYHVPNNISDYHHRCVVVIPSSIQCIQEIVIDWNHNIFADLKIGKQKGEYMTKEKNTKIKHILPNWMPFVCHMTMQQH